MANPPSDNDCNDEFIVHLTNCQNRLYAFILSLLPDPERARDLLQETNIVIWRKANQFAAGTNFDAWACKIAYFEVLAERRRRCKDRHLFSDSLLEQMSSEATSNLSDFSDRAVALEECLEGLDSRQRERLLERYSPGGSVNSYASKTGITPGAAAVALYRIRKWLLDCIQRRLMKERAAWT